MAWDSRGRALYVSSSGGSSLKEISCERCAKAFLWNEPVLLITMGMISMSEVHTPCSRILFFRGAYSSSMRFMISSMLRSVEYLHSIICNTLLPVYDGSGTNFLVTGSTR